MHLKKSLVSIPIVIAFLFINVTSSMAAQFSLESPASIPENVTLPVVASWHNPNSSLNKGIVGLRMKLIFDPKLNIKESDIKPELNSPWSVVRTQVLDGQILIEAIYVKPGTSGDTSTGPIKLATLNFHPKGAGKAQIKIDTSSSLVVAKSDNSNLLETNVPAQKEVNITSTAKSSGLLPSLARFFQTLLRSLRLAK
jgi:hypothetical protein